MSSTKDSHCFIDEFDANWQLEQREQSLENGGRLLDELFVHRERQSTQSKWQRAQLGIRRPVQHQRHSWTVCQRLSFLSRRRSESCRCDVVADHSVPPSGVVDRLKQLCFQFVHVPILCIRTVSQFIVICNETQCLAQTNQIKSN